MHQVPSSANTPNFKTATLNNAAYLSEADNCMLNSGFHLRFGTAGDGMAHIFGNGIAQGLIRFRLQILEALYFARD